MNDTVSTVTLLYVSGGDFQADWIEFLPTTAVEPASWGAIKRLFR